tara:strand:- start:279 stop:644 length:366 start_codon:yes stop_codon:yes gene_type:complete
MTQSGRSQIESKTMKTIAERRLHWAPKGQSERLEFTIRIGAPTVVEPGSVEFPVNEATGACRREYHGFPVKINDTIYGADVLQALQLAVDVDSTLKRFSDRYDFFFPTGEPYFASEGDASS